MRMAMTRGHTVHGCNLRDRQASIRGRSARSGLQYVSTHRSPKRSLAKCAGSSHTRYIVRVAIAGLLIGSCTVDATQRPGAGRSSGDAAPASSSSISASPLLVDVDANRVMTPAPGSLVGVFSGYRTGGHWHIWWTCDTYQTGYPCSFDVSITVTTGALTNAVADDEGAAKSLYLQGNNALDIQTTTTTGIDGVAFDTDPGATITLDAKLGGEDDGAFMFFVQDGQVNGGYQGSLTDPLMLEPAPGGA